MSKEHRIHLPKLEKSGTVEDRVMRDPSRVEELSFLKNSNVLQVMKEAKKLLKKNGKSPLLGITKGRLVVEENRKPSIRLV